MQMNCANCELHEQCENAYLMGNGGKSMKIMFIQDCPGELDDANGKAFYGKSCANLKDALLQRGINPDGVYFTSLVKCRHPQEDPKPTHVENCRPLIEAEITALDPDIIVPMGNKSLKFTVGKVGLTKMRGNAQEVDFMGRKRIILPMMHPHSVRIKPAYKDMILKDLDTLKDLHENGMTTVSNVDYRSLETIEDVKAEILRLKEEAKILCFDLETTGKSPYLSESKIVCISLTDKTHYGVVIPLYKHDSPFWGWEKGTVVKMLRWLLEDPSIPKVAHNGKFDIEWLYYWLDIDVKNFSFDTMLAHYLCISEEQGTQGLKSQAWEFTDMGGYDNDLDEARSKLPEAIRYNYDNIPWDVLKTYAVADVDCCLRLMEIYKPMIDENPKWKTVLEDIMMPASYALRDVEGNGMMFDVDLAEQYNKTYTDEINRITTRLESYPEVLQIEREKQALFMEREQIRLIPRKDRTPEEQKKFDSYKKYEGYKFNFGSVAQLTELLYDKLGLKCDIVTDTGNPSTGEEALIELSKQHEIPSLLLELRKITTLNNMFIQKLPSMRDPDNIVHPSFNLCGTVTGRMSSENPNAQQFPRKAENPLAFQYHNEPKALFKSRYGDMGCVMNADYCLTGDTKVALINGETDTLENICKRVSSGESVYTYSVNPKTEEIEVSRVLAGTKTRENSETLRITLDNGETVTCSDNHKFLLRNGKYVQAKDLSVGTSLMGFVRLEQNTDYDVAYRTIGINANFVNLESEHIMIYKYFHSDYVKGMPIHHKDRNGLNNSLDNLVQIPQSEHFKHHITEFWASMTPDERSEYVKSHITDLTRDKNSVNSKEWWASLTEDEYIEFCKKISDSCPDRHGSNNGMYGRKQTDEALKVMSEKRTAYNLSKPLEQRKQDSLRMYEGHIIKNAKRVTDAGLPLNEENYMKMKWEFDNKVSGWEKAVPVLLKYGLITNHKIIKIEVGEKADLYDIEVENNHNFPLDCGIFVHNCALEMRVAAIISEDKALTEALLSGEDLHKATASKVWGVPVDEVPKDMRTAAKSVNFGVIYGKSGITFAQDLYYDKTGTDPKKTSDWEKAKKQGIKLVEDYLNAFSGLKKWLEDTKKFAYKNGYVETMFGRRRRLPDLKSKVPTLQSNAERQAINAPIQGTGTDLTVLSIVQINKELKERNMKSMIIATVHDSIVFDVYIPELYSVASIVKNTMEHVHEPYINTIVPVGIDLELGRNYGSVFEVELEELTSINTPEAFNAWEHSNKIKKFQKEIKTLHDKGWDYNQVLKYLQEYDRPIKELAEFIIDLYSNSGDEK